LLWVLTALLIVLSSVLWYNKEYIPKYVSVPGVIHAPSLIDNGFGFPINFFYLKYVINETPSFTIRTIEISLLNFIVDFLVYLAAISVPILIGSKRILKTQK
jgi:hypothetical protein